MKNNELIILLIYMNLISGTLVLESRHLRCSEILRNLFLIFYLMIIAKYNFVHLPSVDINVEQFADFWFYNVNTSQILTKHF